jgi:cell division septum initiation protein DivIVA
VNRDQITKDDFPSSQAGYDRPSVDAHLQAVAALTAALEAQVKALEVERDALRRQVAEPPDRAPEETRPHQAPAVPEPPAVESDRPAEPEATNGEPAQQDEEVSARLVATRLAMEGTGREQIREKLEQTYDLDDVDSLVDDVLERLA